MADWNKPDLTSLKSAFPGEVRAIATSAAKMDFSSDTNVPSGAIRYNSTKAALESWNGSSWIRVFPQPGIIHAYGAAAAPTGYLLCDGSAVSRTTYSELFAVLSTTYGVGNGSTTFNLPDFRQRFVLGKAASGTGSTLGGTGGSIDHTHTGPSHSHTSGTLRARIGTKLSSGDVLRMSIDGTAPFDPDYKSNAITSLINSDSDGADCPSVIVQGTTDAAGTGATGGNNPPYQTANYIIKT